MPYASVAASAEVEVYANWALIMVRMTYGSVGANPWTIVQDKLHPAVAEGEFTPLDFSYIRRSENEKVKRRGSADYPRYST
jgi:hypothetical protein